MKKRTPYGSVADMVRGLSGDPALADEFEAKVAKRELIKALVVLRTRAGLSQQEVARKLGCTQSKVSKLEGSDDGDVRFGDLADYAGAVGFEMRVMLVPRGQGLADDVQMHARIIRRLLDPVARLAGREGSKARALGTFLGEAALNLSRLVREAAASLPAVKGRDSRLLRVETPSLDEDEPRRDGRGASEGVEEAAAKVRA